jgi:hypothetical protein
MLHSYQTKANLAKTDCNLYLNILIHNIKYDNLIQFSNYSGFSQARINTVRLIIVNSLI